MDYERVMVFGAHPDDEIMLAGTVAKLSAAGARVVVLLSLSLWVGAFATVALTAQEANGGGFPQRRIQAVAAMLAERPAAFGRPITERAAWDALARHKAFRRVVRNAERYLKAPIPDLPDDLYLDFSRTGNRSRWQRVASKRYARFHALVLGECLENKGRFLPAIDAVVRAICAERTWLMPAHDRSLRNFHGKGIDIDLRAAHLAFNLATARFLLADRLGPATRKLIADEVRRRVLGPYRDMATGKRKANWWTRTTNNWNTVCLAGVTGAALALAEPREERALFVVAAESYSRNFLRGFPPDGYCTEGLGYWNYGFGHFLILAEVIGQATEGKLDMLARKEARAPATFGARIEIANGVYPAFADCSVRARPSSLAMAFISRRYRLGLKRWEEHDTTSPRGDLYQAMMYSFPNSASRTPPAPEPALAIGPRSWFDKAAILLCRPGEHKTCRLAAALKGGHNAEHHNHNDVGSYVVVAGDQAVLVDPGGEVYTARTFGRQRYVSKVLNSFGHPVPLVAGQLQRGGRQARARVVRTEFTDAADTLVLDIASAYKVPELKKLERTFVYSRQGAGSLKVTDRVAFASPKAFGTALVTFGQWKQLGPRSLLVYDFAEAVRVDIEATADIAIRAEEIKEDVHAPALPTRIGIDLAQPVTAAAVTVTITPTALPGEEGKLLHNGGFEYAAWGWRIPKDGMGSISAEQAASGSRSLKLVDTSRTVGSNISSARMAVSGRGFELRGKVFLASGDGVGMYVRYLDAERRMLNKQDHRGYIDAVDTVGKSAGKWEPFALRFTAPDGTAYLQVWIHSSTAAVTTAYLDDLEIVPVALTP